MRSEDSGLLPAATRAALTGDGQVPHARTALTEQPFAVCPGTVVRGSDDVAMESAQGRAQCRRGFACAGLLVGFSRAERYTRRLIERLLALAHVAIDAV